MSAREKGRNEAPKNPAPPVRTAESELKMRHLRFGWLLMLVCLTFGILLESFHGFKVGWYLDLSNSTRRLMFRLAHSHGTLLGLVNVAFALTLPHLPEWDAGRRRLAGWCLMAASLLIPGGFFLGGLVVYGGDPGLGIFLVPVGAILLFTAVLLTARAAASRAC